MSPLDFNPFALPFDGAAGSDLFFGGHHRIISQHHQINHRHSSSRLHGCSGLRLKQETAEAYIYAVDIPTGIKSEDLKMTLEQTDHKKGTTMMVIHFSDDHDGKEFRNNQGTKFHRLLLRSNVDAGRITFCVENGVLVITAPKVLTCLQDPAPPSPSDIQMTNLAPVRV